MNSVFRCHQEFICFRKCEDALHQVLTYLHVVSFTSPLMQLSVSKILSTIQQLPLTEFQLKKFFYFKPSFLALWRMTFLWLKTFISKDKFLLNFSGNINYEISKNKAYFHVCCCETKMKVCLEIYICTYQCRYIHKWRSGNFSKSQNLSKPCERLGVVGSNPIKKRVTKRWSEDQKN
jgi:hypothetical protein